MQGTPKVREWKEVWRTGISVPHNDGKRSLSSLLLSLFSTEDVSSFGESKEQELRRVSAEGMCQNKKENISLENWI